MRKFRPEELEFSQTAVRLGIDNRIPAELMENAWRCCAMLDGITELFGERPILTSGYRCPELNRRIGGSPTSNHMKALAADIVLPSYTPAQVFERLATYPRTITELILEFGRWVHVACPVKSSLTMLVAERQGRKVIYREVANA